MEHNVVVDLQVVALEELEADRPRATISTWSCPYFLRAMPALGQGVLEMMETMTGVRGRRAAPEAVVVQDQNRPYRALGVAVVVSSGAAGDAKLPVEEESWGVASRDRVLYLRARKRSSAHANDALAPAVRMNTIVGLWLPEADRAVHPMGSEYEAHTQGCGSRGRTSRAEDATGGDARSVLELELGQREDGECCGRVKAIAWSP